MPSREMTEFNKVLKMVLCAKPGQEPGIEEVRERNAAKRQPDLPEGVSIEYVSLGGVHAERFEKTGNKGWVFYIHGGGFTFGAASERREITQFIADSCGHDCLSTDYRLAPEYRWPAQIEDCFAAYRAFALQLGDGSRTVLMGESAGGMLVLSLALTIKKHLEEHPEEKRALIPKALVVLSPCVTHAEHFPSHSSNIDKDVILRDMILKGLDGPLFGPGASEEVLKDPIASPLYGDYSGLPPVFISATDAETLYDDACELYRRLREAGHRAELDVQDGCCHAYQIHPAIPEARASLEKAFAFIEKL